MVRTHSYLCGVSSILISAWALSGASTEMEFRVRRFFAAERIALNICGIMNSSVMKKVLACLVLSSLAMGTFGDPKREKCKSPIGCKDFAEAGQNFCDKHRCNSYGCKEHRATLSEPGWVMKAYCSAYYNTSSSYVKRQSKKILPLYCKKHMCHRVMPQWPGGTYDDAYSPIYSFHTSSSSSSRGRDINERLAAYYYCNNERLSGGKYCSEHACKVPTCAAMKWESWVRTEGSSKQVRLDVGETCKAHSAKDPDSIPERTGNAAMTCGERLKAHEEASASNDASED